MSEIQNEIPPLVFDADLIEDVRAAEAEIERGETISNEEAYRRVLARRAASSQACGVA